MHISSHTVVLLVLLVTLATLSSARPLPSAPSSNPKVSLDPVAAALASKIAAIDKQIGKLPVLPGVPSALKLETAATTLVKVVAPATATAVGNPKNKAKTRELAARQPLLAHEADADTFRCSTSTSGLFRRTFALANSRTLSRPPSSRLKPEAHLSFANNVKTADQSRANSHRWQP